MTSNNAQAPRALDNRVSAAAEIINTGTKQNQIQSRNVSSKTELKI